MGTLWTLQLTQPVLGFYNTLLMSYGTAYYLISLSANIILTILIMIRLFMYRRRILAVLPKAYARHYVSLAAIIIESAILYSVFALIFIITYAIKNPLNLVFLGVASFSQVCISDPLFQRLELIFKIANFWLSHHLSSCSRACLEHKYFGRPPDAAPNTKFALCIVDAVEFLSQKHQSAYPSALPGRKICGLRCLDIVEHNIIKCAYSYCQPDHEILDGHRNWVDTKNSCLYVTYNSSSLDMQLIFMPVHTGAFDGRL
jgi:hypothetical protein